MTDESTDVDDDSAPVPPPAPSKSFTQEEVNAMLAKQQVKLRKEFADYPQLKVDSQELRQLREASKSAEEKLRDERDRTARERDLALERARGTMVRAAVVAEAAKQGATDPDDVAQLIDQSELIITDDGVDGVKEAVEMLLAKKRYLVGGRRRGGVEIRSSDQSNSGILTRSQIRRWMHGEDGGLTPERQKMMEEAYRAGNIDANR